MNGLIGRKVGMTSIFDGAGKSVSVTVIEAVPNIVTQVKSVDSDGYNAIQLSAFEAKEKNTTNALVGHFKAASTTPKKKVVEFRNSTIGKQLGEEVNILDVFAEGDKVSAVGTSKGKGFQGVVKRHGFAGVGDASHGQHNRLRAPGSMGASSWPSRVFKGMRVAVRMGGENVKMVNLQIVKIIPEQNLVLVKGAIPGAKGSYITIEI